VLQVIKLFLMLCHKTIKSGGAMLKMDYLNLLDEKKYKEPYKI
jgi:hypothetical protein